MKEIVPKDLNFSQTSLFNRLGGEGEFLFIPPICRPIAPEELQPPKPDAAWEKSDAYKRTKSPPYKSPSQLAIDRQNALYVLDSERQAIYKFDAAGTLLMDNFDQDGRPLLDAA